MARFEGRVPLDVVVRVARDAEADLDRAGGLHGEAFGEQVELRAGQQLADLVAKGEVPAEPADPVPSPRTPS
ncbi:MAG TPA: hypothetical protein VMU51_21955 [Mycobacteriales bacterium]|nr:hypothetical protein [Mycobacteriales bacterium]